MSGALFALGTALSLGINQILTTYAVRRWGTVKTTFAALAIAFSIFIALALSAGTEVPIRGNRLMTLLVFLSASVGLGYLASFASLREGPLSVVSPIGATAGVMTVLFAFVLLGERPSPLQWVGIPTAAAGAVAVSMERDSDRKLELVGRGPLYAALAVVLGAASGALVRIPVRELGSMETILLMRGLTVAVVAAALAAPVRARPPARQERPRLGLFRSAALLLVIGALDAAAFLFYAEGLQRTDAWLVGLVSQSGRAISVVGGFVLFAERLRKHQWLGVTLVAVGLALAVTG